jgi:hypothetical protein
LSRHQIRRTAAETVLGLRQDLVERTRREGGECAALIDLESGSLVGNVLVGDQDEVNLTEQIAAMSPVRRYIQVHTHPEGTSLSDADAAILLGQRPLAAMVLFGTEGTTYLLSKRTDLRQMPQLTTVIEWNRAYEELYPRYQHAVRSRRLSQVEARRRHTHSVMQRLSRTFDLRYSRIRGAV